jgi:gluconate 2-dehydrogenase gamma chain
MRQLPTTESHHFTPEARQQVEVLFEAILPGSETRPGARDAGATEFLDRLLAVDEAVFYEVGPWRELYAQALPALDAAAQDHFGHALAELPHDLATELLVSLAAGELDSFPEGVDQKRLFSTLRGHCIDGCFSDPRWGGNHGGIAWRWLGYPAGPALDLVRAEDGALREAGTNGERSG